MKYFCCEKIKKVTRTIWILMLTIWMNDYVLAEASSVSIITDPVIFRNDVKLLCNIKNCCDTNTPIRWFGGRDNIIISYNQVPLDRTKYAVQYTSIGVELTIRHFDIEDANKNYTCINGFEKERVKLSLDNVNYEMHPVIDSIRFQVNVTGRSVETVIFFDQVYPEPKCYLKLDDTSLETKPNVKSQKNGTYFIDSAISISGDISSSRCVETLNITCEIGTDTIVIVSRNISLNDCQSSVSISNEVKLAVVGVVVALVVLGIVALISVITLRKLSVIGGVLPNFKSLLGSKKINESKEKSDQDPEIEPMTASYELAFI